MLTGLSDMLIYSHASCKIVQVDFWFLKIFLKCENLKYVCVDICILLYLLQDMLLVRTHIRSTIKKQLESYTV